MAGRQRDLEAVAPAAGVADFNGAFALVHLPCLGRLTRIAARPARARQQQRAGQVSVVGNAEAKIEAERFIELLSLTALISVEGEAAKLAAEGFFEPRLKVPGVFFFDEPALARAICAV
jgi:hypothetical protein